MTQPPRPSAAASADPQKAARGTAETAKKWRDTLRDQGYVKVELWIPPDMRAKAKALEQALRARAIITATPHLPHGPKEGRDMTETIQSPWTVHTLQQALTTSPQVEPTEMDIDLVPGAAPTLRITMLHHGNLPIYLNVNGEQILASTLLWPMADQEDRNRFNEFLLRTHKLVPLSTYGIVTIDGVDYYELFGALSARSSLSDVLTELRMLATNAIAAAELRAA